MLTQKQKLETYDAIAAERGRLTLALRDVLADRVVWTRWRRERGDGNGKWRLGLLRCETWPLVIVCYRFPGQRDLMQGVVEWEPWRRDWSRLRVNTSEGISDDTINEADWIVRGQATGEVTS